MDCDILNYHPNAVPYLDYGFVVLLDVMGNDKRIADAARVSYGGNHKERTAQEDENLIRYLYRNKHTSPFEMCVFTFLLKIPIFVMRQHVRHRTASLNEFSGRYSEMKDEMYLPRTERFLSQSKSNKQMGAEQLPEEIIQTLSNDMLDTCELAYENYKNALKMGLARETARIQLPLSTYTELYWKIDLKNLFHYLKLRDDKDHAQNEIVELASIMGNLIQPHVPIAYQAFLDYDKNALSFSALELEQLQYLLKCVYSNGKTTKENISSIINEHCPYMNETMSNREITEFITKITKITFNQ